MDNISKAMLTVIAVALCAIAFKLYNPSCSFGGSPTFGDIMALRDIIDPEQRKEAHLRILRNIPIVRVQGGQIDAEVSGTVNINN